jgi:DNA-binding CsgD family transcriptional regulator
MTGTEHHPQTRRVLVAEPLRLVREALIAAVDASPGLAAIDGSTADRATVASADAVIVAASLLRVGWHRLFAAGHWDDGPSPVVVVADHGPTTPSIDGQGVVVVSRHTPLGAIVDCLRRDDDARRAMPMWSETLAASAAGPALTARERQVLGLLASGLTPAEVAQGLSITTHTARDHIKAIRAKLERPTIMSAVLEAIRRGLLHMDAS